MDDLTFYLSEEEYLEYQKEYEQFLDNNEGNNE
jgi:hypothetical protein